MPHKNTKSNVQKITASVASVIVSTGIVMNSSNRRVKATGKREDEIVEVENLKRADTETTKTAAVQTPKINQTKKMSHRTQKVTQMIHYVDEDERPVYDDYTASLIFEQTGILDNVTGKQTWNSNWLPKTTATFSAVEHPVVRNHHLVNPEINEVSAYDVEVTDDTFKNPIHKVHKVVYAHDIEPIKRTQVVTQTIHYRYEDGAVAHDDHVVSLIFTQSGKRDLTNGKEIWDSKWSLTQTFEALPSPVIIRYTADKPMVGPDEVTVDSKNFLDKQNREETVIYSANTITQNKKDGISEEKNVNNSVAVAPLKSAVMIGGVISILKFKRLMASIKNKKDHK